jgi:hypothetical protein
VRLDPEIHRQTFEDHGVRPIDDAVADIASHLDATGVQRVTELLVELDGLLLGDPQSAPDSAARVMTR